MKGFIMPIAWALVSAGLASMAFTDFAGAAFGVMATATGTLILWLSGGEEKPDE